MPVDPVSLQVFKSKFESVAEEMGVALQRTAYSPNIKERRDFSCAVFNPEGDMVAQAADIPVHLGAMPASVKAALEVFHNSLGPGDIIILNDPYMGGSHLPDISMVSPIYAQDDGTKILAASIRSPKHIIECAKIGADVVTAPFTLLNSLIKHPLTDSGLKKFIDDYKAT